MEPSAEGPRRSVLRHPALRRLPLIAVAAIGLWLWQSGAQERQLYYLLPSDRSGIERVKIVLRDDDGRLVRGDELFFEEGRKVPPEIVTDIRVSDGLYRAEITVRRRGQPPEKMEREVRVKGETASVRLD